MAVSLETRVPFLDHRVAELAARNPAVAEGARRKGKQILRELLYREAPRALFDRPKAGFGIPVGEWIKGPLRPWVEDLLSPSSLAAEGLLDPAIVRRRWADHLSGRRHSTRHLGGADAPGVAPRTAIGICSSGLRGSQPHTKI